MEGQATHVINAGFRCSEDRMFGYLPSDSEIAQLQVGEYARRETDKGRDRRSQT